MEYIEKQKTQSRILMEAIFEVTGRVPMVMGGAPRNWFGGRSAKDIDVYYQAPADEDLGPLEVASRVLKEIGVNGTYSRMGNPMAALYEDMFETNDTYDTYNNKQVHSVVDCSMSRYMEGQSYQLIRLHVDPYVMMKQFPVNLSMCGYTMNGDNVYSDEFMDGMRRKMIVATHPLKRAYQQKICDYYHDFAFIPYDMRYLAIK